MRSLYFNLIDLSAYGLTVQKVDWPMIHGIEPVQLYDLSVAYDSHKVPITISAQITISAATTALLRSYIDSIRGILNERDNEELRFDVMDDRYWLARFESMGGGLISPQAWQGDISFLCLDPVAYSMTETTDGPTAVDADPKTLPIVTGGNARISPVYTLVSGENLGAVTITLENDETGDLLSWTGTMGNAETLIIDVEHWLVTLEGAASMDDVTGEFPQLLPNQSNDIIVDGFSNTGTLKVVYRNRYV